MRRLFLHSPKVYAAALALGILLTALVLRSRGSLIPLWWADGLSAAGAVLVLLGLLGLAARLGAFDTVGYSFSTLGSRRYKDLFAYSEAKKEKRSRSELGFMPFLTVGAVFLVAGLAVRVLGVGS